MNILFDNIVSMANESLSNKFVYSKSMSETLKKEVYWNEVQGQDGTVQSRKWLFFLFVEHNFLCITGVGGNDDSVYGLLTSEYSMLFEGDIADPKFEPQTIVTEIINLANRPVRSKT